MGFFIHFLQCKVQQNKKLLWLHVGGKHTPRHIQVGILQTFNNRYKNTFKKNVCFVVTELQFHCHRPGVQSAARSHDAGFDVLTDALRVVVVVMVIVGATGRGVEGGDAVKV